MSTGTASQQVIGGTGGLVLCSAVGAWRVLLQSPDCAWIERGVLMCLSWSVRRGHLGNGGLFSHRVVLGRLQSLGRRCEGRL